MYTPHTHMHAPTHIVALKSFSNQEKGSDYNEIGFSLVFLITDQEEQTAKRHVSWQVTSLRINQSHPNSLTNNKKLHSGKVRLLKPRTEAVTMGEYSQGH